MNKQNAELKANELKQEDRGKQPATQQVVAPIDQLTDLQINDRQAADVKGGPLLIHALVDPKGRPYESL
ncbi:MAG TPA: hypothetical protein PLD20_14280 [Blastocatellia bacterium]|nr:hypothetical protein [Blastocatellia bacterium]HMV84334.1 hypothetical protein [Blastocatellia bacterium]HMX28529.1 hypothetical protein [Blastocatellia bacterium]HMZ19100.1 hypothetical protein [Blastocatellia bacterium]HNG30677.1 hypothetical protein [Blastocatellia bacterium]